MPSRLLLAETREDDDLIEALSLFERARPVIGEDGPYERARQRRQERRQANGIPAWFSAEDLLAAPWETAERQFS
jgi:hypothetical protein